MNICFSVTWFMPWAFTRSVCPSCKSALNRSFQSHPSLSLQGNLTLLHSHPSFASNDQVRLDRGSRCLWLDRKESNLDLQDLIWGTPCVGRYTLLWPCKCQLPVCWTNRTLLVVLLVKFYYKSTKLNRSNGQDTRLLHSRRRARLVKLNSAI